MRFRPALKLLLLLLLLTAACSDRTPDPATGNTKYSADMGTVGGVITYRERIALTNGAVVEIALEDITHQDVAARVIATQTIENPGQVPIRFELEYPVTAIDDRMSYALRARISDRGRLMFANDTVTPVLTRGAGRIANLALVRVGGQDEPAPEALHP